MGHIVVSATVGRRAVPGGGALRDIGAVPSTPLPPEPITPDPPEAIARPLLTQSWLDLTFVHWAVDPADVAGLPPPGTVPDTLDGVTYVGLVAFRMHRVGWLRLPGVPYALRHRPLGHARRVLRAVGVSAQRASALAAGAGRAGGVRAGPDHGGGSAGAGRGAGERAVLTGRPRPLRPAGPSGRHSPPRDAGACVPGAPCGPRRGRGVRHARPAPLSGTDTASPVSRLPGRTARLR